jgi:hypothetical protein
MPAAALRRALALALPILLIGGAAMAEPYDQDRCSKIKEKREELLTPEMRAALDQGPDWVKSNLTFEALDRVRRFLRIEEEAMFRCRPGRIPRAKEVAMPMPARKPEAPLNATAEFDPAVAESDPAVVETIPLPDRPLRKDSVSSLSLSPERGPSQAVADSLKATEQLKETR